VDRVTKDLYLPQLLRAVRQPPQHDGLHPCIREGLILLSFPWTICAQDMEPNPRIIELLLTAYEPCPSFSSACKSMRWVPERGHIPRGFCGATGDLDEVDLVLVCAEPGDPHPFPAIRAGSRNLRAEVDEWPPRWDKVF